MTLFIAMNCARLPTASARTVAAAPNSRRGSIGGQLPERDPTRAMCPSTATAFSDCSSVPAVSTTRSTPRPADHLVGAQIAQALFLVRAACRDDHSGAQEFAELHREQRYAAGAGGQNGLSALDTEAVAGQGVPGRDGGAGKRCRFGVGEAVGDGHQGSLGEDGQFGQHSVERTTQLWQVRRFQRAIQPPREQCGGDAVAWPHPPDVRPDGDDLTGTVRDWYDVRFDRQHVLPPQHQKFAEAERGGMDRDRDLPGPGGTGCVRTQ